MRKWIGVAILGLMLAVSPAFAGSGVRYVCAYTGEKSVAVSLKKPAEYVSMVLTVGSDQRDPQKRFADIQAAAELILEKSKGEAGLLVHRGSVSLSPRPMSKLASVSSYSVSSPSVATLHVLVALEDKTDVYACASRIRRFVDAIKMPAKAEYSLGPAQLTMADPEKHRKELLEAISDDLGALRTAMRGAGTTSINGLERPVLVRQIDDRNVELFIDYTMTVTLIPMPKRPAGTQK